MWILRNCFGVIIWLHTLKLITPKWLIAWIKSASKVLFYIFGNMFRSLILRASSNLRIYLTCASKKVIPFKDCYRSLLIIIFVLKFFFNFLSVRIVLGSGNGNGSTFDAVIFHIPDSRFGNVLLAKIFQSTRWKRDRKKRKRERQGARDAD